MKLATVNVIEIADDVVLSVNSFTDDDKGNREAEKLFTSMAVENGMTQQEKDMVLEEDEGYRNGTYHICITHSS